MPRQLSTIRPVVSSNPRAISRLAITLLALVLVSMASGCVYRIDIQQGNLLEEEQIDQVVVGMTKSQVRFLLGTPMVQDAFHEDRWDYMYYFRQGRSRKADKRWLVIRFQDELVSQLERDLPVDDKP